jgi:hypothetical protein
MCSREERRQRSELRENKIKDALRKSGMYLSAHLFSWRVASMREVKTLLIRYATDCSGTISIPPACVMAARDFS